MPLAGGPEDGSSLKGRAKSKLSIAEAGSWSLRGREQFSPEALGGPGLATSYESGQLVRPSSRAGLIIWEAYLKQKGPSREEIC